MICWASQRLNMSPISAEFCLPKVGLGMFLSQSGVMAVSLLLGGVLSPGAEQQICLFPSGQSCTDTTVCIEQHWYASANRQIIASSTRHLHQKCYLSSLCEITPLFVHCRWSSQVLLFKMPLCSTLHIVQGSLSHCCLNFELCPLPSPCLAINRAVQGSILLCSIVEIINHSTLRLQSQQNLRYQTSCS